MQSLHSLISWLNMYMCSRCMEIRGNRIQDSTLQDQKISDTVHFVKDCKYVMNALLFRTTSHSGRKSVMKKIIFD